MCCQQPQRMSALETDLPPGPPQPPALQQLPAAPPPPRPPPLPSLPAHPHPLSVLGTHSALTRHSSSRQGDSVQKAIDALILRHNNSEHSGSCEELAFIDVKLRCPQLQLPLSAP